MERITRHGANMSRSAKIAERYFSQQGTMLGSVRQDAEKHYREKLPKICDTAFPLRNKITSSNQFGSPVLCTHKMVLAYLHCVMETPQVH
jgi:hypothetical protein